MANVDVPVCKGMKTTVEKAEALERLDKQLKKYENMYDSLVVLGDCPIVYSFTDLAPCFSQPWPDLLSFDFSKFKDEIDEKINHKQYPLIIFADFDQDQYEMMDENKKNYMLEIIENNQYEKECIDDYFTIYTKSEM